jgi:hypothetical protein
MDEEDRAEIRRAKDARIQRNKRNEELTNIIIAVVCFVLVGFISSISIYELIIACSNNRC